MTCDNCNGKYNAKPVYIACDPFEIFSNIEILNQFEGLVLHPLCDNTTGDIVGYVSVVRTEEDPPAYTPQYFDVTGAPIANAPANSAACLPLTDDFEFIPLCELTNTQTGEYSRFLRRFVVSSDGSIECVDTELDGKTPYVVNNEIDVIQCPDITSQEICYQDYSLLGNPTEIGDFSAADSEGNRTTTVGPFGGTFVSVDTDLPQGTVAGNDINIPVNGPFPKSQRVTLTFSRPIANLSLNVSELNNVAGNIQRLHSFNVFPNNVGIGNVDIGNGTSVEAVGLNSDGALVWNNKALSQLTFTYEVYESPNPTQSFQIGAFSFDETSGTLDIRKATRLSDGFGVNRYIDSVTGLVILADELVPVECPECPHIHVLTAYIEECHRFDNDLPIRTSAIFDSSPVGTNTITIESVNFANLIRTQVAKAVIVEQQEITHGLPVTHVSIETVSGAVYSFPPSALVEGNGTILTIDDSDITTWGINQTDSTTGLMYSSLEDCSCRAIEVIQSIDKDGFSQVLDIVDPGIASQDNGVKPSLLNEVNNLPFGVTGPFPGPCPDPLQVLEINQLCCNNDLIETRQDLTAQFDAWMDAASPVSNFLEAGTGVPILGVGGERVGEILNPLGVGPSWDGQGQIPGPIPDGGPHYELDRQNGLPAMVFDGATYPSPTNSGDHLELETGLARGTPFQLFFLYNAPVGSQNTFVYGYELPGNGREDWQIQSNLNLGIAYIRYRGQTQPIGATSVLTFATAEEVADGRPHLITMNYEGSGTNILRLYFDGELRLETNVVDDNPQLPGDPAEFEVFNIGLMRNAGDNAYTAGDVYESIFAGTSFSQDDIAAVNAYLICKWGIDPSLAVGGAGDLVLGEAGAFDGQTPFVERHLATGDIVYRNTLNGQEFPLPPVPGLAYCDSPLDIVTGDVSVFESRRTTDFNIGAGALSYSIFIESGTAEIGGSLRPTGYSVNQVPQSYGGTNLLYPEINVTNVTGVVHLVVVYP